VSNVTGIALIGGGRWAHVLASVVVDLLSKDTTAIVVSESNPDGWADWLSSHRQWESAPTIEQALARSDVSHVVIARRAKDHAKTCLLALAAGKAVLVEKPFCLTLGDLDHLLEESRDAHCGTGLVFHFARNQSLFREACQKQAPINEITLDWGDPKAEVRHGQAKSYDPSLNVLQDVMPHAWSIIHPFLHGEAMRLEDVAIEGGGRSVTLNLRADDVSIRILMQRDCAQRTRLLRVNGADWQAQLDFATEPGHAEIEGATVDIANGFSSPLAVQLRAFLENRLPPATAFMNAQDAIRLSVEALGQVRFKQAKAIQSGNTDAADYARREIESGGVSGDGIAVSQNAIDDWLDAVAETATDCLLHGQTL
jgi:hypothetical protein